jgi:hypothetical protein
VEVEGLSKETDRPVTDLIRKPSNCAKTIDPRHAQNEIQLKRCWTGETPLDEFLGDHEFGQATRAEPDRKPIDMIAGHDAPLISIQNPHFAHNFKLQIRTAVLTDPCEGMTGDPVRATAQPAEDQKRII